MRNIILYLLCLIFLLYPSLCPAVTQTEVSVILSSRKEPYQQTYAGFKGLFAEREAPAVFSKYNLEQDNPEEIIRHLSQKKPTIILTVGTKAAELAKNKIKDMPVVFSMVLDPAAFADSNLTGVSLEIPISVKLDGIKRVHPHAKRIGIVYAPGSASEYGDILHSADKYGFQIIGSEITSVKEFPDALKAISWRIDAFLMISDVTMYFPQSVYHLLLESLKGKFPVVGLSSFYTKAGAMVSFEAGYHEVGREAGEIALRVLGGESPEQIKPIAPGKLKCSLNPATAERLDLTIPSQEIGEMAEVFGK